MGHLRRQLRRKLFMLWDGLKAHRRRIVMPAPVVLTHAEELVQTTGVKTPDALHLGSALAFQAVAGIRIPFITADIR